MFRTWRGRPSWEDPGATNWIDARKAFFVIESRKQGGMGAAEAVPFGNREAADAFAAANGGRVVTFTEIPSAYVLGSDARRRPEPNMIVRMCGSTDEDPPMLKQNLTRRRMIAIAASAAGSAFLTGGRTPRPAMPCVGTDRHSARRCRSRSTTRTGPRPNGWSSAVPGGRAAAGAAIQPVPGRLGDLHPQPHRHSCFSRR